MSAVVAAKTPMDLKEVQDLIHRKDGITYKDVEAILSNLYQQNQKMNSMEKEMAEFRAVVMKQRETMEKTDEAVAKLESRVNEQETEIMKLRTEVDEKGTTLKQVIQENKKCVAEVQSAKKSIEHIKRVVDISVKNAPRKAIIKHSRDVNFSQNKKIESSSRETNQVLDKINSTGNYNNASTNGFQGDGDITNLRTGIHKVFIRRLYKSGKHIRKQFRNGKAMLQKRNIATEGVAFSAYLDHEIQHMGTGHTIKCNQVLLNDGNHYNAFTGTFTVPQTGVYLLTFNFAVVHVNDLTQVQLMVNNREIVDAAGQVTGTTQRISSGNTAIIKLNQGESVWLKSIQSDSEVVSYPSFRWTTFSGVFLY